MPLPTDMPPVGSCIEIVVNRRGRTATGTLHDPIPSGYVPSGYAFCSDDGVWCVVQRHMIVRSIEEPGRDQPQWERLPADWWWRS